MDAKSRVAGLAVTTNILLVILKVAVGLSIGSVSVLAEAVHSAVDLLAALMALVAVRISARPADDSHPYGHGKVENVTGTVEAVLIFGAAVIIVYESINKLIYGVQLESVDAGLVVIGISVAVNFFVSRQLSKVARRTESVALEADAAHLTTDVVTSAGVFLGLLAVRVTGLAILDPLVALGVAILILKAAWEVTQHAFVDLLDRSLPAGEQQVIRDILDRRNGEVIGYHNLRSRKAGPDRHIDLHLMMHRQLSVGEAHEVADEIEGEIKKALGASSTVNLHVEPCEGECEVCDADGNCRPAGISDRAS
ncbi:MAG: cation diffusion facilitator family transporter [Dehalococcoidales bacterium]|nr:cation diffusion facilitator family transporter [Dehalococcoidales bacterium]